MRRLLLLGILALTLLVGCGTHSGFTSAPTAIRPAGASGGAATASPGASPTSAGSWPPPQPGPPGARPRRDHHHQDGRLRRHTGAARRRRGDGADRARMLVGAVDLCVGDARYRRPEGGVTDGSLDRPAIRARIWFDEDRRILDAPTCRPRGAAGGPRGVDGQIVLTHSRPTQARVALPCSVVTWWPSRWVVTLERAVCLRRRGSERPRPVPDRGPRGRPLPGPRIRHDPRTGRVRCDRRQARDRRIDGRSADLSRGVLRWHLGADGLRPRGRNGIRAPAGDGQRDRAVRRSPRVGSDDVRCRG